MDNEKNFEPATWLTRKQAGTYLGLSSGTLANWASMDMGPGYTRIGHGRVLYRLADIEQWLQSQPRQAGA